MRIWKLTILGATAQKTTLIVFMELQCEQMMPQLQGTNLWAEALRDGGIGLH